MIVSGNYYGSSDNNHCAVVPLVLGILLIISVLIFLPQFVRRRKKRLAGEEQGFRRKFGYLSNPRRELK